MWPSILNPAGERDGRAFGQCGGVKIDLEMCQLPADAGIEGAVVLGLGERQGRRGDRTDEHCGERAAIDDHDYSSPQAPSTDSLSFYRSKSSLVMKGEVVTHQLDCAAAASAVSALTCPALVAAVSASCRPCALPPSVSQITMYLVKATPGGPARGCGVTRRKRCAAIQPGN